MNKLITVELSSKSFRNNKDLIIERLVAKKFSLIRGANYSWEKYLDMPVDSKEGQWHLDCYNQAEKEINVVLDQLDRAYRLGTSSVRPLPFDLAIPCFVDDDFDIFLMEDVYMYPAALTHVTIFKDLPADTWDFARM